MSKWFYSGKFWLKTLALSLFLPFALWLGSFLILHLVFSEAKISQALKQNFPTAQGVRLEFDPSIERSLLPRPSFILHNLKLIDSQEQTLMRVGNIQVALDWQSFFSEPRIQTLALERADLTFNANSQQHWQLAGIAPQKSTTPLPAYISLTDSLILIHHPNYQHTLFHTQGYLDASNQAFSFSSQRAGSGNHSFQISGNYQEQTLKPLIVQAQGTLNSQPYTLLWQGSGSIGKQAIEALNGSARLTIGSLNLDATTQNSLISGAEISLPDIHFAFTSSQAQSQYNGSGSISNLSYSNDTLTLHQFNLEAIAHHPQSETALNLSGSISQHQQTYHINHINLTTRHTQPQQLPTWVSSLQGNINISPDNWQAQFSGTLDNQTINISASQNTQTKQPWFATLNLSNLNFSPYQRQLQTWLNGKASHETSAISQWLQNQSAEITLNANKLDISGSQISKLHSQIHIRPEAIEAKPISLALYQGQANGSLSISQSSPYRLAGEMDFRNIEIKPLLQDSLRFHHLQGSGNAHFQLHTQGQSPKEWQQNLSGSLSLSVQNGAWQGINLQQLIALPNSNRQLINYDASRQTPFTHLTISANIKNGIGYTPKLTLESAKLNLSGQGQFNIPDNSLNYAILASSGNGLWLPLKIQGNIDRPSFALDYQRITNKLTTPEQKQNALQDIFSQPWQWLQNSSPSKQ